jgi:hypothetical protein
VTAKGAKVGGVGFGFHPLEADITIELEGKQYNVCLRPIEDDDGDGCSDEENLNQLPKKRVSRAPSPKIRSSEQNRGSVVLLKKTMEMLSCVTNTRA